MLGVSQSIIDSNLTLKNWASWKEQLSFGADPKNYNIMLDLPIIDSSPEDINFLYFVIAHEFGHIFDFANNINSFKECNSLEHNSDPECEVEKKSWAALSWKTNITPLVSNYFENREKLCFYTCEGNILSKSNIPQIYNDLYKTNFISLYAATQPWDDFADSFAYFYWAKRGRSTYNLMTQQGMTYDINAKLKSPLFKGKYRYLEKFSKSTNIVYP